MLDFRVFGNYGGYFYRNIKYVSRFFKKELSCFLWNVFRLNLKIICMKYIEEWKLCREVEIRYDWKEGSSKWWGLFRIDCIYKKDWRLVFVIVNFFLIIEKEIFIMFNINEI